MSPIETSATIQEVDANFCIASWRQLFVVIWRHDTNAEGLAALRRTFAQFAATHSPIGLLTIVEAKAPLPPAQVRSGLASFLTEQGAHIKRSAVVFEGEGFRAAAVRGVVTGLTMLARPPYPHKVFGSIDDACAWLAPGLVGVSGVSLPTAQIWRALTDLRASLEPSHQRTA